MKDGAVGDETRITASLEHAALAPPARRQDDHPLALGPARRKGRPEVLAAPSRRAPERTARRAGDVRRRLHRRGGGGRIASGSRRRFRAVRERALSRRGRSQRSGLRARTRPERRHLRQRCLRHGAPRARVDRRRRKRLAGLRRLTDGSGTRGADQVDRESGAAVRVRDRRRQGRRQSRRVRELARARQRVRHRRRHGQHVSRGARDRRRQIAARSRSRTGEVDHRESGSGEASRCTCRPMPSSPTRSMPTRPRKRWRSKTSARA